MEIDRPSPAGEWLCLIDARIWFQAVQLDWQGQPAPFIEGGITLNPAKKDPMTARDDPRTEAEYSRILKGLFVDRIVGCRMPRPAVEEVDRYGADLGTMQAITAALTTRLDQIRR